MDSGDDPDAFGSQRRKRSHRHSPRTIELLEAVFRECPHPDEKQRRFLGNEVGLEPRQIKYWFQNRRTQMKNQVERADNSSLRSENERMRLENLAMREALSRAFCPNCGGPPFSDEDKLRSENSRLKDELHRISMTASKNISQVHRILPMAELSLSVEISPEEKTRMEEEASAAMEELGRLAQEGEPLWKKREEGEGETLDEEIYSRVFSRVRNPNSREEGSRATCIVMSAAELLVDALMDMDKWMELFPDIILRARPMEVLSSGVGGRNGSLLLIQSEEQFLSPIVTPRETVFLRYCRQIDQRTWAVADVSRTSASSSSRAHRKLPSGCVIQDMFSGLSQVTWVEHVEVEARSLIHPLYRSLIINGTAFGAHRRVCSLQRACERFTISLIRENTLGGTISLEGKKNIMKFSHRMVSNFCKSMFNGEDQRWSTTYDVRVAMHQKANSSILSVATSTCVSSPPHIVFNFLRNKNNRPQWDVLSSGSSVEEIAQISTGEDPGNRISLLRSLSGGESSMLILQESFSNSSCSMVIYSPIDMAGIKAVMDGQDEARVPLLPSGFAIVPGERGSLMTVAFQILVSGMTSARMNSESVATVNNLICSTVRQIKAALSAPAAS